MGKTNIRLPNETTWPLPLDEEEAQKLNCYDSDTVTLTRAEAWRLRDIVSGYSHLTTHPAGVGAAVRTLRLLRRAVRKHFEEVSDG